VNREPNNLSSYVLETIKKYYRIERKEICFLKFIFEAYDGIAMLTTLDSDSGVVMFHIAPGCEDDVEMILQDLQHNIMIEEVVAVHGLKLEIGK